MSTLSAVPSAVAAIVGEFDGLDEVRDDDRPTGLSSVWLHDDWAVKTRPAGEGLDAESKALEWLSGRFAVPRRELFTSEGGTDWLVVTRLAGERADRFESLGNVEGSIQLLGESLRQLHDLDLPASEGSFGWGWDAVAAHIGARLEAGRIDPQLFPEPYSRYDARRLVDIWMEGRPSTEDLVVCHGRPEMAHVIVDGPSLSGVVSARELCVADRHLDLAVMHRSLQEVVGGEAAFIFYDAYGMDPDLVRLDHYVLADLLR